MTTTTNSATGRRERLYYETCIPASLLILAAWAYGAQQGGRAWVMSTVAICLAIHSLWQQRPRKFTGVGPQLEDKIRAGVDDGMIWGVLLVPLIVFAKSLDMTNGTALSNHLAISLAMSLTVSIFTRRMYASAKMVLLDITVWVLGMCALAYGMHPYLSMFLKFAMLFTLCFLSFVFTAKTVYSLPGSFTLGEAAVAVQGICVVFVDAPGRIFARGSSVEAVFLEVAVLGLVLLAAALFYASKHRHRITRTLEPVFFSGMVLAYAWLAVVVVNFAIRKNLLAWAFKVIFLDSTANLLLIGYWVCVLGIAALLYLLAGSATSAPQNKFWLHVRRKSYHALATLLFLPGVLFASQPLHLGFSVALIVFVVVECLRALDVHPLAPAIDRFLRRFTDHRDAGLVVTSHFYLLLGCALPVWLGGTSDVARLAGVLTLGLADTAASLVGTRYGRHKWPGSPKTLEGSAAFAASLCAASGLVVYALVDQQNVSSALMLFALCIGLAALEALTEQNDNMVVPLTMYAAVHVLLSDKARFHAAPVLMATAAFAAPSVLPAGRSIITRHLRNSKSR
ncbi:dolichol kinase [Coemansia sp. IMI 203386]|nr:dolichol kinase [Coemansia sp. IMI 203386]